MEYGVEWHIFVGEGERRPSDSSIHTHAQAQTPPHTTVSHRVIVLRDLDILIFVFMK